MKHNWWSEGNHSDGVLDQLLKARVGVSFRKVAFGVSQAQVDQRVREEFSQCLHGLNATVPEALQHKINKVDAMASLKDVDQSSKTKVQDFFRLFMAKTLEDWMQG